MNQIPGSEMGGLCCEFLIAEPAANSFGVFVSHWHCFQIQSAILTKKAQTDPEDREETERLMLVPMTSRE